MLAGYRGGTWLAVGTGLALILATPVVSVVIHSSEAALQSDLVAASFVGGLLLMGVGCVGGAVGKGSPWWLGTVMALLGPIGWVMLLTMRDQHKAGEETTEWPGD